MYIYITLKINMSLSISYVGFNCTICKVFIHSSIHLRMEYIYSTYICMYTRTMHVYVCIYVCMCTCTVYVCICMYVYVYSICRFFVSFLFVYQCTCVWSSHT